MCSTGNGRSSFCLVNKALKKLTLKDIFLRKTKTTLITNIIVSWKVNLEMLCCQHVKSAFQNVSSTLLVFRWWNSGPLHTLRASRFAVTAGAWMLVNMTSNLMPFILHYSTISLFPNFHLPFLAVEARFVCVFCVLAGLYNHFSLYDSFSFGLKQRI